MTDVQGNSALTEFPLSKSRSQSPQVAPDESEDKPSRKRGREISLEPAQSVNKDSDQSKLQKDSATPAKRNRTCDSPVEEESGSSSGSLSGSPRSPSREVKRKVRQINQGVEDPPWQKGKKTDESGQRVFPPHDNGQQAPPTDPNELTQTETEKGVKRKFLERGTSAGPSEPESTAQEAQKRLRDDPDEDVNPRETKRPTPPPESKPPPPRSVRSPPPSPKRPATGFAAYSGTKSPFSQAKAASVFGKSVAKPFSPSPQYSLSSYVVPPTSPNNPNCIPDDVGSATPVKRSGFDAFVGSSSPFAAFARSKSPVLGSTKPLSSGKMNSSAFSNYASGGAQAFTPTPIKRSRPVSPQADQANDDVDNKEEAVDQEEKPASFGEKLRSGKDVASDEDEKPIYEEQEITTGEENENTVHHVRAKLFALVDNQWKERGIGQLRLNVSLDGSTSRLVMRKEAVHVLLLNVLLFPGMKCSLMQDPRYLRFSAIEDGQPVHYNVKVSNPKIAQELLEELINHIPERSGNP